MSGVDGGIATEFFFRGRGFAAAGTTESFSDSVSLMIWLEAIFLTVSLAVSLKSPLACSFWMSSAVVATFGTKVGREVAGVSGRLTVVDSARPIEATEVVETTLLALSSATTFRPAEFGGRLAESGGRPAEFGGRPLRDLTCGVVCGTEADDGGVEASGSDASRPLALGGLCAVVSAVQLHVSALVVEGRQSFKCTSLSIVLLFFMIFSLIPGWLDVSSSRFRFPDVTMLFVAELAIS